MSGTEILALLMLVAFFALLMAGVPVALTLATTGFVFGVMGFGTGLFNLLPARIYGVVANYQWLAIPLFVQMVKLPYRILAPAVILVCTAGTYSVNGSIVETWLMFAAGLVGFFMKRHGFSPAALVLALVLGPLAEQSLRQSLTISRGSFGIFLERPMSLWILGITAVVLALGLLMRRSSRPD